MATGYRLESNGNIISATRSNDGTRIRMTISNDESNSMTVANFDSADFMRFLSTLSKNWGK